MLSLVFSLISLLLPQPDIKGMLSGEPKDKPQAIHVNNFYAVPGAVNADCMGQGLDWRDISVRAISGGTGKISFVSAKGHDKSGKLIEFSMMFSDDSTPTALRMTKLPNRLPETPKDFFGGGEFNAALMGLGLPQIIATSKGGGERQGLAHDTVVLGFLERKGSASVVSAGMTKSNVTEKIAQFSYEASGTLIEGNPFSFICKGTQTIESVPIENIKLDGFTMFTPREIGGNRSKALDGETFSTWYGKTAKNNKD